MPSVYTAWDRRTILLGFRVSAMTAVGILLWAIPPGPEPPFSIVAAWLLYTSTTTAYVFLSARVSSRRPIDFCLLCLDLALQAIVVSAYAGWNVQLFYPLFLLSALLAALARRLQWALGLGGAGICILFLLSGIEAAPAGAMVLQAGVILATALIVGRLAEDFEHEENHRARLESMLEVSSLVAGSLDPDVVYRRLTEVVARLFGAGRVAVILAGNGSQRARVAAAVDRNEHVQELWIDLALYPEIQTAIRTLEPVVIDRLSEHPEMAEVRAFLPRRAREAALLVTPIHDGGSARGVIFVRIESERRTFSDHELRFCQLMADVAARAVQHAEDYVALSEAARRDGLTGLFNVREFQRALKEEIARSRRVGASCSLLMIDVDYLKHVNDVHGHQAGDAVLKSLASSLLREVREIDTVARYGGEEFAVLLPETDIERARIVAERLRQETERLNHRGLEESVTVSIGIAAYPDDAVSPEELVHRSDRALYASKNGGRNRVLVYGSAGVQEERAPDTGDVLVRIVRGSLASPGLHRPAMRHLDIITSLITLMHARDGRILIELEQISRLSELILARIPMAERQAWAIQAAALVRDIGKVTIPAAILEKSDTLTREEYELVRGHAVVGARILAPLKGLEPLVPLVRHHHERWDGTGYPDGLSREAIPYGARIVGLIDAFHAMAWRRPYRERGGVDHACDEIRTCAGSQFDPRLAERFLFAVSANRAAIECLVETSGQVSPAITTSYRPSRPAASG